MQVIKLLMGWNIIPGQESNYFDFFVREFEPAMPELGLQTTDVWFTAYGDWPQIITGLVAPSLEDLNASLASAGWRKLKARLLTLVTDYQQKIIVASGEYQL